MQGLHRGFTSRDPEKICNHDIFVTACTFIN